MATADAAMIAVDWGTSRLRAVLLDGVGVAIEERESDDGIGTLSGGHEAAFEALVTGWPPVPALMAGMVGSRQGWREAAYVPCPATLETLATALLRFTSERGRAMAIVPGLVVRDPARDGDVIRGEETQILGVLAGEPDFAGLCLLPGTHSKWVSVAQNRISDFQTYLSGEMFELLSRHSFLRHSVTASGRDLSASPDFALGIRRTAVEGLPFPAAIFSVRVRQLLDNVNREDNLAYLSGLIIGGEIAAAIAAGRLRGDFPIRIVGTPSLAKAYVSAFAIVQGMVTLVDGSAAVVAGLRQVARASGLLTTEQPQ
jgi:2-dehydro-3-deoxygalactonokinase